MHVKSGLDLDLIAWFHTRIPDLRNIREWHLMQLLPLLLKVPSESAHLVSAMI